MTVIFLHS